MFEIGWSELLVIGVVLIVVVGPKDLPKMLRTFGRTTTHLRKMAGDFRKQFDEALREAELDEVRDSVKGLRSLDPRQEIRKALNPMKAMGDEIRSSLTAATKAPEPTVPSPAAPLAPAVSAGPSVIGATEMEPAQAVAAEPRFPPAPESRAEGAVGVGLAGSQALNGSAVHDGLKAAGGEPQ